MITIASGGCNVISYLTADPREIIAVDLNAHHVALTRLKLAGARHFPNYATYFRFFGRANDSANIQAYQASCATNSTRSPPPTGTTAT